VWVQKERKLFDFHAFDNASRGPLGSFLLLSTTKCRSVATPIFGINLNVYGAELLTNM
jgi:hypothetical protein